MAKSTFKLPSFRKPSAANRLADKRKEGSRKDGRILSGSNLYARLRAHMRVQLREKLPILPSFQIKGSAIDE